MYHKSPISGIASYESKYIATAGYDNQVILWDTATHDPIAVSCHDHLANQVEFSPCGRFLVSSSSDYSARIWSVPSLTLLGVLPHDDDVEGLAFNQHSTLIATASRDRCVRVFKTSGELVQTFSGHTNDVLTVAWINDDLLISCGDDSTLRYWCLSQNSCIKVVDLGGMETDTLCVSPDGRIVSGNDDGEIVLFDADGHRITAVTAHKSGIKRLVLNENRVISLSYDRTFKTWLLNEDNLVEEHKGTFPNIVWPRSCAFVDDHTLAFVTFGDRYALFDLTSGHWHTKDIRQTQGINAICTSLKGQYTVGDAGIVKLNDQPVNQVPSLCNFILEHQGIVLCGGQDGAVYNALTGNVIHQHNSPLNCCVFFQIAEQAYAGIGTYTGELIILKYDTGSHMAHTVQITALHDNAIKDVSINDRQDLFSVCADHTVKLSHISDKLEFTTLLDGKHDKIVNGCANTDNGFISVSRDLTMKLWGDRPEIIQTPHKNSIKCVASNKASLVASGDYRGMVAVYNINTRQWRAKKISSCGVSALSWDEKDSMFLATLYDGSVQRIPAQA